MVIRITAAAVACTATLLAGCGSDTVSAPAPTSTSTISDEDQISDVITRVSEAQAAVDIEKIASLTCAKYRDQVSGPSPDDVPPMNTLPLDVLSSLPPDKLAESLGAEYAGASKETVQALADALIRRDEAAYKVAMAKVMAETMQIHVDKVENVAVKGDTATADVTIVISTGGKVTYTPDVAKVELVKEDGQWKDCTPKNE
jgi:hypothetical protein